MKPPYKQSCFTDLHTKYGEIIDRVLDSIRSGSNTVTNRETTSGFFRYTYTTLILYRIMVMYSYYSRGLIGMAIAVFYI